MQKHIHILGICGTFMGGVAMLARQLGYRVTGSDENVYPPMSTVLHRSGVEIFEGFKLAHLVPKPDLVIVGNVCKRGVEAVEYMLNEQIPFFSGPSWLEENVLRNRHVLAVSGTHGKTTTTSILAWILSFAGLNPGYLIGGLASNFECTAALGQAPFFVIEADEYDSAFFDKRPKFLHYFPRTLILNNIEFDHADIYQDLDEIKVQFHRLIRTIPGNGLIIHPEEKVVGEVLSVGAWSKIEAFTGKSSPFEINLTKPDGSEFEVKYNGQYKGRVRWGLMGGHNVENALAAMLAANHVGIDIETSIEALHSFKGVKRRLEFLGEVHGVSLYDDFAHHPTAIFKTLEALRTKVGKKSIVAILQFASNTMREGKHDIKTIASALNKANRALILDSSLKDKYIENLRDLSNTPIDIYHSVNDIVSDLMKNLKSQDQVLIMSNKGFDGLQEKLLQALKSSYLGSYI